jgi:uncharacterized membrane protein YfbV (UPF0208 family)
MKKPKSEINTFTKAPVYTQIIAYIIVTTEFLIFSICLQSNYANQNSRIILSVLYYTSFVVMVIFWMITSKIDPTDPYVTLPHGSSESLPEEFLLYCQKCRSIVK